jgi:hypothetical protein
MEQELKTSNPYMTPGEGMGGGLAKKSGKFTPKMPFLEKKFSHLLRFSQI